jgi:hypothetical protein
MTKKRNINAEKWKLKYLLLLSSIWILAGWTILMYIILITFSSIIQPEIDIYFFGIFAGLTGAVWGVQISEVVRFWNWLKYGSNFYKKFDWTNKDNEGKWYPDYDLYSKNLIYWKKRCIFSLIFLILLGIIIGFIIN